MNRPLLMLWAGLAFMACGGLVAAVFEVEHWTSDDLASWVQAIGSILAVGGAAVLGIWQNGEQERRELRGVARADDKEQRARIQDRSTASSVMDVAQFLAEEATFAVEGHRPEFLCSQARMLAAQFAAAEQRMIDFPIEILRHPGLIRPFTTAQLEVARVRSFCEELACADPLALSPDASFQASDRFHHHRMRIIKAVNTFRSEMLQERML